MSAVKAIDKQISSYLVQLNPRQKKAVLSVVKTFAEEQQDISVWKDAGFVAEMDKRIAELETGKVKGHDWDMVKQKARQSVKLKKKK